MRKVLFSRLRGASWIMIIGWKCWGGALCRPENVLTTKACSEWWLARFWKSKHAACAKPFPLRTDRSSCRQHSFYSNFGRNERVLRQCEIYKRQPWVPLLNFKQCVTLISFHLFFQSAFKLSAFNCTPQHAK